jgi:hypothetical protein
MHSLPLGGEPEPASPPAPPVLPRASAGGDAQHVTPARQFDTACRLSSRQPPPQQNWPAGQQSSAGARDGGFEHSPGLATPTFAQPASHALPYMLPSVPHTGSYCFVQTQSPPPPPVAQHVLLPQGAKVGVPSFRQLVPQQNSPFGQQSSTAGAGPAAQHVLLPQGANVGMPSGKHVAPQQYSPCWQQSLVGVGSGAGAGVH